MPHGCPYLHRPRASQYRDARPSAVGCQQSLHAAQYFRRITNLQAGREQTLAVQRLTAAPEVASGAHHAAYWGTSAAASPAEGTWRLLQMAGHDSSATSRIVNASSRAGAARLFS